ALSIQALRIGLSYQATALALIGWEASAGIVAADNLVRTPSKVWTWWGGPPGPRGTPGSRCSDSVLCPNRPTRASAADQGVRPTSVGLSFWLGRDQFVDIAQLGGIVARIAGIAVIVIHVVRHRLAQRRER